MVEKLDKKKFASEKGEHNILSLLSTPTNNFGLGLIFKKLVILND
jgi:hypothetical protein